MRLHIRERRIVPELVYSETKTTVSNQRGEVVVDGRAVVKKVGL